MNNFIWESGRLGWGLFAVIVFTLLWVLAADLYWRLRATAAVRLAIGVSAGWAAGVALIIAVSTAVAS